VQFPTPNRFDCMSDCSSRWHVASCCCCCCCRGHTYVFECPNRNITSIGHGPNIGSHRFGELESGGMWFPLCKQLKRTWIVHRDLIASGDPNQIVLMLLDCSDSGGWLLQTNQMQQFHCLCNNNNNTCRSNGPKWLAQVNVVTTMFESFGKQHTLASKILIIGSKNEPPHTCLPELVLTSARHDTGSEPIFLCSWISHCIAKSCIVRRETCVSG
jgi:hypothetical protein